MSRTSRTDALRSGPPRSLLPSPPLHRRHVLGRRGDRAARASAPRRRLAAASLGSDGGGSGGGEVHLGRVGRGQQLARLEHHLASLVGEREVGEDEREDDSVEGALRERAQRAGGEAVVRLYLGLRPGRRDAQLQKVALQHGTVALLQAASCTTSQGEWPGAAPSLRCACAGRFGLQSGGAAGSEL